MANGLNPASNWVGKPRSEEDEEQRDIMASEGTIRIHRSIGGTGAAFRVSYVPYEEEDESGGERAFRELQQVRAFLKMLGIGAEVVKDALWQLTSGRSASIPNISLSDKAVRSASFVSVANLARSNS